MAVGEKISCDTYRSFLVNQLPVYDQEILRDVRPPQAELLGYYRSGTFPAFSSTEHTVDRVKAVQPNLTKSWRSVNAANCEQPICDPPMNKLGWGYERLTYGLEEQSWQTDLLCFDQIDTKTKAKEHFNWIISDILRPATIRINSYYLMRKAAELASRKIAVTTGLPEFTFTWDAGGYEFLNTTEDPTGRLTPPIIQQRVNPLYAVGAMNAGMESFQQLQLHTDNDTLHYMAKDIAELYNQWRFSEFGAAAKEFYKYGLSAIIGDYAVKVLHFPMRFNKIANGRYQVVLPYKNEDVTEGIGDIYNGDYNRAQYQFSYINNPGALRVMGFKAEAINSLMPFMVRDYAGKWNFAMNDLGADCKGQAIANFRKNKGFFWADFRLAIKPEHPEWLELYFHKRDIPCITILSTCNADPGYPAQSYDSANELCPSVFEFTATANGEGNFVIDANTIQVDGNTLVHTAISEATLEALVAALPSVSGGTWAVRDADENTIQLDDSTATTVTLPFVID
jgi:hypothetical protein